MELLLAAVVGAIVQIAIQGGLDRAANHLSSIRLPPLSFPSPSLPTFTRLIVGKTELINRTTEIDSIRHSLQANGLRIVYFVGDGGSGKTRLLEEVGTLEYQFRLSTPLRWSNILDLYHTDLHNTSTLQDTLTDRLDPEQEHFKSYRSARYQFKRRREQGVSSSVLIRERSVLEAQFLEDYALFARTYRPVITLDTLESVVHETDFIQSLCDLDYEPIESWDWMLQHLNTLKNTVLVLAGRPEPVLEEELRHAANSAECLLQVLSIKGLQPDQTHQLLKRLLQRAPRALLPLLDHSEQLWKLTQEGRPVQLALVIELVSQNLELMEKIMSTPAANRGVWNQRLVHTLFDPNDSNGKVLFLLALARKGLTPTLLQYLTGWPKKMCHEHLDAIRNRKVVKAHPSSDALFLHDALYELFDAYPSTEPLNEYYQQLAEYYRQFRDNPEETVEVRDRATVHAFYYTLQYDPLKAFEVEYLPWSERAIKGHKRSLEMQLRDELLRFLKEPANRQQAMLQGLSPERVQQDSAIRWIKRFLMRQDPKRAIRVAERLLTLGPLQYESLAALLPEPVLSLTHEQEQQGRSLLEATDAFFWGHLLTFYGEALAYISRADAPEQQAQRVLVKAILLLEGNDNLASSHLSWFWRRITGRAWNTLGYLYRTYGHYRRALEAYNQALHYFTSGPEDEQADTLNNRAFLLALLGESEQSLASIDRAVAIRRRLAQPYPLALSYNTRGRIHALQGTFSFAQQECEEALRTFEALADPRGIGLTCNALGFILRLQGQKWKVEYCTVEEATVRFEQSGSYLEKARALFAEDNAKIVSQPTVIEPLRHWEAYNESGSLYREWGHVLHHVGKTEAATEKYQLADQFHRERLQSLMRQTFIFRKQIRVMI